MANESLATLVKVSYKGLTGHWTKWGGGVKGELIITQFGVLNVQTEWACQSCGKLQPIELSPFLYKHPDAELDSERIRVCAVCFDNDCYELKRRRGEV